VYFFYFFPVGLDIEIRKRANITYFLSVFMVICFLLFKFQPFGRWWNFYALIFDPSNPSIKTAISHAFLHGGFVHIAINLLYLVVFGRAIEDRFGPLKFYLIFTITTIAGAYTHMFLTRAFCPENIYAGVIGASGATSGLLGAFLVRFYYSRIKVAYWVFMPFQGINRAGRVYVPSVLGILLWFAIQLARSFLQFGISGIHVAYSVHLGSFAAGVVLAYLFGARGQARAEKYLAKARRYFEKADWFASQAEYINYLHEHPDDIDAYRQAARAFLCTNDRVQARGLYREAVRRAMEAKRRDLAEEAFLEAMRQLADFVLPERLHLDLAYGMERTLKFNSALIAYRRFLELYPNSTEAPFVHLRVANVLEGRFHREDEAVKFYRRLIENYPDDPWVDFARAEVSRLEGAAG